MKKILISIFLFSFIPFISFAQSADTSSTLQAQIMSLQVQISAMIAQLNTTPNTTQTSVSVAPPATPINSNSSTANTTTVSNSTVGNVSNPNINVGNADVPVLPTGTANTNMSYNPPVSAVPTSAPTQTQTTSVQNSSAVVFTQNLKVGTSNSDVKTLQTTLQGLGYFPPTIDPTGYFGLVTKEAVIKFQSSENLPTTGYVGPMTRGVLNSAQTSGSTQIQTTTSSISTPTIISVTPSTGAQGATVQLTFIGTNMDKVATITPGGGNDITLTSFTIINPTTIVATYMISSQAVVGAHMLTILSTSGGNGIPLYVTASNTTGGNSCHLSANCGNGRLCYGVTSSNYYGTCN